MRYHYLPPPGKINQLEPYLLFTAALVVLIGIFGGWAGNAWPWVLGVCLIRFTINFCIVLYRKRGGNFVDSIIIDAVTNFIATLTIIILVDSTPNPFWLLFVIETVASALYRSIYGILIYFSSAIFLLGFVYFTQGLDNPGLASGSIYSLLALIIGLTTNRGLELLYTEQTNREKVEEKVYLSEQRLRQITNNMLDILAQMDNNGVLYFVSPSFRSALGYDPQELCGHFIMEYIHPEDLDNIVNITIEAFALAASVRLEVRLRHADGHYRWFECVGKPSHADDRLVGLIFSGRDITERKRMEEKVQASLREKEVLLKEIHHRVKNNLQVISSLLNLQSQKTSNHVLQDSLRESQDRVHTMALIHEKLYQSDNLAEIEFGQYINNLAVYLLQSYQAHSANISLNIHCDQIYLDIDTSMPCGLILNELISNAIKHAFPHRQTGEITIQMRMIADHQITLVVADDGIGFPPGFDPFSSPSLGLQLLITLVDQLDGKIRFENDHGMRIEISFKSQHQHRGFISENV